MGLIDTHTHLESFARRDMLLPTLEHARAAGVEAMITIGTSPDDWDLYRELAVGHPGFVHYSVGLHPCSVDGNWADALSRMEAYWERGSGPPPVALGEIGLDRFHLPKDDEARAAEVFGWQREAFAAGLEIAKRLDCPVVIHSRGAFAECVEMIDRSGVDWSKVVFHCYVEGEAEMHELLTRGGYGSFTGILTYKSAENVREAARVQGLDRLMLETDAPYLTPMPHRGKPNEPAFVKHTAEYAAKVFGVPYETIVERTAATAKRFFGLQTPLGE